MTAPVSAWDVPQGHYVCVRTPGWLAQLIRWSTHSPFNHVFVTGPDGLIAEATPRGVHLSLLDEYAGMRACANTAERMTLAQEDEVWSAARAMVDDPYNWPDLAAIAAADLGWHWNLAFRLLGDPKWRICSQLAALAGKAAGLNWFCKDRYSDQVTPGALARRPGVAPVSWAPR